jgi:hypothetical protein
MPDADTKTTANALILAGAVARGALEKRTQNVVR